MLYFYIQDNYGNVNWANGDGHADSLVRAVIWSCRVRARADFNRLDAILGEYYQRQSTKGTSCEIITRVCKLEQTCRLDYVSVLHLH